MAEIYTMDNLTAYCAALDTGDMVEVDEELWMYFLEVLPPVRMGYKARVPNAERDGFTEIHASFGFAEGAEPVTAFWRTRDVGQGEARYFAQRTAEMNPHA